MVIEGVEIVAVQASGILDSKICDLCAFYDGMIWDIGNPGIPNFPIHEDCRCILIYIGAGEVEENWKPDFKNPPKKLLDDFATFRPQSDSLPTVLKTQKGRAIKIYPILDNLYPEENQNN